MLPPNTTKEEWDALRYDMYPDGSHHTWETYTKTQCVAVWNPSTGRCHINTPIPQLKPALSHHVTACLEAYNKLTPGQKYSVRSELGLL